MSEVFVVVREGPNHYDTENLGLFSKRTRAVEHIVEHIISDNAPDTDKNSGFNDPVQIRENFNTKNCIDFHGEFLKIETHNIQTS